MSLDVVKAVSGDLIEVGSEYIELKALPSHGDLIEVRIYRIIGIIKFLDVVKAVSGDLTKVTNR